MSKKLRVKTNTREHSVSYDGYPCNCCGMTFTAKEDTYKRAPITAGKGLRVITGEQGKPVLGNKVSRDVVQTRNGALTVLVRVFE